MLLDAEIWNAVGRPAHTTWDGLPCIPSYSSSVDAALSLVPSWLFLHVNEMVKGYVAVHVWLYGPDTPLHSNSRTHGEAVLRHKQPEKTVAELRQLLPVAICLAVLRARQHSDVPRLIGATSPATEEISQVDQDPRSCFDRIWHNVVHPQNYVQREHPTIGGMWTVDRYRQGEVECMVMDEGWSQMIRAPGLRVSMSGSSHEPEFIEGNAEMLVGLATQY